MAITIFVQVKEKLVLRYVVIRHPFRLPLELSLAPQKPYEDAESNTNLKHSHGLPSRCGKWVHEKCRGNIQCTDAHSKKKVDLKVGECYKARNFVKAHNKRADELDAQHDDKDSQDIEQISFECANFVRVNIEPGAGPIKDPHRLEGVWWSEL
eukprot:CAMPEP_0172587886 /NCGR_PEP_ID=MMETSP1068-20121228/6876_1 /TAXON_ID=35684 /ORGANISM="Pseudopedinella elastica, Strain CCMP716" /LENGTH=152 /DNA_ID=CAMNT_0013383051 /DNA_START=695 /DNA_END=1153 /DNA_ORIENTATION=-